MHQNAILPPSQHHNTTEEINSLYMSTKSSIYPLPTRKNPCPLKCALQHDTLNHNIPAPFTCPEIHQHSHTHTTVHAGPASMRHKISLLCTRDQPPLYVHKTLLIKSTPNQNTTPLQFLVSKHHKNILPCTKHQLPVLAHKVPPN